jgi:nitrogen fixation/metabolism regulation signal transduction histidine kinase
MHVYLLWVGLIVASLATYLILLWKRSVKGFRFQARLTILFLLFILLPSIPLTFSISALITENTDFLLLPGFDSSLNHSIETIRLLLEERAQFFCNKYPKLAQVTPAILEENRMAFVGVVGLRNGKIRKEFEISTVPTNVDVFPEIDSEDFSVIVAGKMNSTLRRLGENYYFEVYRPLNDSTLKIAGYWVEAQVAQTKEEINTLLRIAKFRERIVAPDLIWAFATVFIILLAALAIWAAKKFSRGISEPIQYLSESMQKVAAGDLNQRVDFKGKDEIQFLIDSFNRMTADLKNSQEKLIRTERIAAWRDVARQVSHEIKNPLTPIQIALFRLREKIEVPANQREIFEHSLTSINEEIESLKRLADEFSQFARLPQPQRQSCQLNEIIRSVAVLLEAEPGMIKLKLDLANDLPRLELDREQIKRVLNNLIKNSVEASPNGGTILIQTQKVNETHQICLRIKDHGEGIEVEALEKLFEPYYSTKKGGRGLGLAIVKRIIEDHDGRISVTSQKGFGTEIEIWL